MSNNINIAFACNYFNIAVNSQFVQRTYSYINLRLTRTDVEQYNYNAIIPNTQCHIISDAVLISRYY